MLCPAVEFFKIKFRNSSVDTPTNGGGSGMKFPVKEQVLVLSGFLAICAAGGCTQEETQTSQSSRSETCVNGVCTTTSSSTNTRTTGTSRGSGVGVTIGNQPVTSGGIPGVDVSVNEQMGDAEASEVIRVRAGNVSSAEVAINPCMEMMAPLNACAKAGAPSVMMPRHIGCTDSGANAWVCRDMMPSAPPYPVVACSGLMDSTCNKIGQLY